MVFHNSGYMFLSTMNGFILVSCFSSNDLVLQNAEKLKEVRGKKIFKFSLVPWASKVKYLLVLLPNDLSGKYCLINLHWIFYLPSRHWVEIFACPA